jgi:DNA-binding NarL/FixJ family response regulator
MVSGVDSPYTAAMPGRAALIGRERELAELEDAVAATADGRGGLQLIAGEAGVGKTRLAQEALAGSGLLVVVGAPTLEVSPPYGPIVAALRSYLHTVPDGLQGCGSLAAYLALLLPELGRPPEGGDRSTLFEAIRCAFEAIARRQPVVVFLDDLQWADNATFDLLSVLAGWLERLPLLVLGTYRSDELPRGHPLRRLRLDLRRAGRLRELVVEPLDQAGTAALAAGVLGQDPGPELAAILYDRTQGLPFFIEELAAALAATGRLRPGPAGLMVDPGPVLPIPDTVRDAILLRLQGLSDGARAALEIAAVAGLRLDLDLVVELDGDEHGLKQLIDWGLLVEVEPGVGAFRHALAREAIYGDILRRQRRVLHRRLAERLEALGAPPGLVAEHWEAAREPEGARRALLAATRASWSVHAYRDAAQAARRALELWPEGREEIRRLGVLERLGECAELTGDLTDASRAWREAAEGWREAGRLRRSAEVERRLAAAYQMQGAWQQALAARQAAGDAFATSGLAGEAAAERLAAATHLRSAASFRAALDLLQTVHAEADQAGRLDLKARALGLEGNVRARMGQTQAGLDLVRAGLSLALEHDLPGPAAEVYQRLADSLEHAGDYARARESYLAGFDYCRARGEPVVAQVCLACLTAVLRQIGEWDQAVAVCRDVLASVDASPHARTVASGMLGSIYAFRGEAASARPFLLESATMGYRIRLTAMEILNAWSLGFVDELGGADDAAAARYREMLDRWGQSEERHFAISPLRWATSFFAVRGDATEARACASALGRIAADNGTVEALAALAHGLGEMVLLDGDPAQAARQFNRALDLLRQIQVPFDHAHTLVRAGVALAAAGERELGIQCLADAYRTAGTLHARPLAAQVAREFAALGESAERWLGRRPARALERAPRGVSGTTGCQPLTARECEVATLVARGYSSRLIAEALVIGRRTAENHVAHICNKLGVNSRAQIAAWAVERGLLAADSPASAGRRDP